MSLILVRDLPKSAKQMLVADETSSIRPSGLPMKTTSATFLQRQTFVAHSRYLKQNDTVQGLRTKTRSQHFHKCLFDEYKVAGRAKVRVLTTEGAFNFPIDLDIEVDEFPF
jgi:hypothetical protein